MFAPCMTANESSGYWSRDSFEQFVMKLDPNQGNLLWASTKSSSWQLDKPIKPAQFKIKPMKSWAYNHMIFLSVQPNVCIVVTAPKK